MNFKRPTAGESEEDILKQEEEFLKLFLKSTKSNQTNNVSAATAVKKSSTISKSKNNNLSNDGNYEYNKKAFSDKDSSGDALEMGEPILASSITERKRSPNCMLKAEDPTSMLFNLPTPSRKNDVGVKKKKSLFAQRFDATHIKATPTVEPSSSRKNEIIGHKIHPYLAGMTEEDILKEQQKLLDRLDPKLVAFVRSRKKKPVPETSSSKSLDDTPVNSNSELYSGLPIDPTTVKNIPGMGKLEMDKLSWTGILNEPRPKPNLDQCFDARFDFQGFITTSCVEDDPSTLNKGLHHHGEEMNRAGYTLEELLTLAMSSNTGQKAVALRTIGNIFKNAHKGMYDTVLERNIFDLTTHMDFIYAIRKAMDCEDLSVINFSLECLANMIYPEEEEYCLDLVYLWDNFRPGPWLNPKMENMQELDSQVKERELKDPEFLNLDLLGFLIERSRILERIEYCCCQNSTILKENGVVAILRILIRSARHSPEIIVNRDKLLCFLYETYLSKLNLSGDEYWYSLVGTPQTMTLKLFRLLIDSSYKSACTIFQKYSPMQLVTSCIAIDDWNSLDIPGCDQLVLECFRAWIAFLYRGLSMDEYVGLFPVLMKFLLNYNRAAHLVAFDVVHSGHLFAFLFVVLKMKDTVKNIHHSSRHSHWILVKESIPLVEQFLVRILTVFRSETLRETIDEASVMWCIFQGLNLLLEAYKYSQDFNGVVLENISQFCSSRTYETLTQPFSDPSKSSILSGSSKSRYSKNFSTLDTVCFGGNFVPTLQLGLRTPLFSVLFRARHTLKKASFKPLNQNILSYVNELLRKTDSITPNFYMRFELSLLKELLWLLPANSEKRFYLSFLGLSNTPKCLPSVASFFLQSVFESLDDDEVKDCISVYKRYIFEEELLRDQNSDSVSVPAKRVRFDENTKGNEDSSEASLDFRRWTEPFISYYWIFEPLKRIHTIVTTVPEFTSTKSVEILRDCIACLKFTNRCLAKYGKCILQTRTNLVDIYFNVCHIFLLGNPGIYWDPQICALLKEVLRHVLNSTPIKHPRKQIFSFAHISEMKAVFDDFYKDLVIEFNANSYFNEVFLAYLLVPIRSSENANLKSIFWQMDCLDRIRVNENQGFIPVEFLSNTPENDIKNLELYMDLLSSSRITSDKNPFLHKCLLRLLETSLSNPNGDEKLLSLSEEFKKLTV